MLTLAIQDLNIGRAIKAGTLRTVERPSRFGGTMIAIEDARGVIEVCDTQAEADERIAYVKARV